jgi:hypothetical protein
MKQNYCYESEPAVPMFISVLYSNVLQLKILSALLTIWSSSFMLRAYWILRSKSGVIFPSFAIVFLTTEAFCFTDLEQNKRDNKAQKSYTPLIQDKLTLQDSTQMAIYTAVSRTVQWKW